MNVTELCVNCKQNNSCTMCWKTSNKKCPHFIQKTNADRIRDMSDEELAVWLEDVVSCLDCPISKECNSGKHCRMWMKKWLKQPAEVEND